ncbi:hypothetical protein [Microvirga zambiensis]|uniref:hypothetical protein n=1 Tax=Microvirga zambiensis TaxID=1402137 RepID=UPI00191F0066|nr:hypothetical protein [Microvirga zambiensis]
MTKDLYHPSHVAAALDRIADLEVAELRAELQSARTGLGPRLPDEALVRVIRRSRVQGDEATERLAYKALMERLTGWAWKAYSTLSQQDRQDLVASLCEVIVKAVAKTDGIDFWEITFARNRDRAAADIYQQYLSDLYGNVHEEFEAESHGEDDGGDAAIEMAETALIEARAAQVLTREEMRYFHPLFLSEIPLKSPRASTDLVRMLGKPEGTLREIKTTIKNKLQKAWEPLT